MLLIGVFAVGPIGWYRGETWPDYLVIGAAASMAIGAYTLDRRRRDPGRSLWPTLARAAAVSSGIGFVTAALLIIAKPAGLGDWGPSWDSAQGFGYMGFVIGLPLTLVSLVGWGVSARRKARRARTRPASTTSSAACPYGPGPGEGRAAQSWLRGIPVLESQAGSMSVTAGAILTIGAVCVTVQRGVGRADEWTPALVAAVAVATLAVLIAGPLAWVDQPWQVGLSARDSRLAGAETRAGLVLAAVAFAVSTAVEADLWAMPEAQPPGPWPALIFALWGLALWALGRAGARTIGDLYGRVRNSGEVGRHRMAPDCERPQRPRDRLPAVRRTGELLGATAYVRGWDEPGVSDAVRRYAQRWVAPAGRGAAAAVVGGAALVSGAPAIGWAVLVVAAHQLGTSWGVLLHAVWIAILLQEGPLARRTVRGTAYTWARVPVVEFVLPSGYAARSLVVAVHDAGWPVIDDPVRRKPPDGGPEWTALTCVGRGRWFVLLRDGSMRPTLARLPRTQRQALRWTPSRWRGCWARPDSPRGWGW